MLNFFLIRIKKVFIYIIYNLILQNFSKDYLNSKNIFSIKLKKNTYIKFLIKCLIKKKIRIKKFKFFYIFLVTIIYEISASCWSQKKQVFINNKVNKFELYKLFKSLSFLLPTGFVIKIFEKKNIFIFNKNNNFGGIIKILLTNNKNLFNDIKSREKYKYLIFFQDILNCGIYKNTNDKNVKNYKLINSAKFNNKLINLKQLKNGVIIKKIFYKKNYFKFFYKKFIYSRYNSYFKKKIKFKFYNLNKSIICSLKQTVVRGHGLIVIKKKILRESLDNCWYDKYNLNFNRYKIDRHVNDTCIILPTGVNVLGHFIFESLIRLYYVRNYKNIKIIINENISNSLIDLILNYKIRRNQILIKPLKENWKIKNLIFPSLGYLEISKPESNFLSIIKKNKAIKYQKYYEKIYISRRDSSNSRNLINEIEIEDFLRSIGYKIILASKLSISDKISFLSNAKIIITPLGSGIQNVYFCKRIKAKILLIGTERYFHQKYFLELSYLKKINLYFICAKELSSFDYDYGYLHSSFYLDLKAFKQSLIKLKDY